MKTKSKSKSKKAIRKRNPSPQENSKNRIKALRFIMSTCENIFKNADRASGHLSMIELANIATYVDEIQNAFGLSGLRLPEYSDEVYDPKRRERELNYSANRGPV